VYALAGFNRLFRSSIYTRRYGQFGGLEGPLKKTVCFTGKISA
jgi:hypothetical protein